MVESLRCTLRSWVHEIFSPYRTVSPQLEDNYASKCSSDSFPHTKHISLCVENCQITLKCIVGLQLRGEGHEIEKNYVTNLYNSFPWFSSLLPGIGEQQNIKVWFSKFFTHDDIYFMCENCRSYILTHICRETVL